MLPLHLLALLTTVEPVDAPASTPAPIINGTYDPGDPAVVGLHDSQSDVPFCTGTLVSRHVVVSAGHCVEFGGPSWIYFGSDATQGGEWVPVRSFQAHPMFDYPTLANDISVVILDAPAPADVTPVPMASLPPAVGAQARFVGFGYTEVGPAGEYGRKYQMTTDITSVDATLFSYGVATCNGDSGGPAFLTVAGVEVLAGVTSSGDTPCATFGEDTRVDVYRDFIDPIVAAQDPPGCDGDDICVETCPARDTDCPIVGVGDPCESDFDCGDNFCQDVCWQLCPTGSCPDSLTCTPVTGGRMACLDGGDDGCGCQPAGRRPRHRPLAWLLPATVIGLLLRRKRARR